MEAMTKTRLEPQHLAALQEFLESFDPQGLTGFTKSQLREAEKRIGKMLEERAEEELDQIQGWLRVEPGIWRVEFNKSHGQTPRISYVETVAEDTKDDVLRWQGSFIPRDVHIVDCRRADESDAEELLDMIREEQGW